MILELIAAQVRKGNVKLDEERDRGLKIPEDLVRHVDIPYGPDPKWNLLDIYYPAGTTGKLPVIVNVHGGGFYYGDKEANMFYTMDLAERGFAVVNFNYHLSPQNKFPVQLEEINKVMEWIAAHGQEYHIDTERTYMTGDSAGAQMTFHYLVIRSNPKFAEKFSFTPEPGVKIRAAGLSCGIYDLFQIRRKDLRLALFAYGGSKYVFRSQMMNPLAYADERVCPLFVMTFRNDFVRDENVALDQELTRLGIEHEFRLYGGKEDKESGHVHNLHIQTDTGKRSNDEQCAFFRKHEK